MALNSPGVETFEIDNTATIQNAVTGRGAIVGQFQWGPSVLDTEDDNGYNGSNIETVLRITNESELVRFYGKPDDVNFRSFFSAANFLQYGNDLRVVRAVRSDAVEAQGYAGAAPGVAVEDLYARFKGAYGNNITMTIYDSTSTYTDYSRWNQFKLRTGELLLVVYVSGQVVENNYCSVDPLAVDSYGNSLYIAKVLDKNSIYVFFRDFTGPSTLAASSITFKNGSDGVATDLDAGYVLGWDLFKDRYELYVNLLIAGDASDIGAATTQYVNDVAEIRQDCLALISPPYSVFTNDVSTSVAAIVEWKTTTANISSTYVAMDGNFKYQYDKYNDVYRWVPLNADVAGLCVYTDSVAAPWFSPAGNTRGRIRGISKLKISTNQSHRDSLYENMINPVVAFSGQGFFLYGDVTTTTIPTAYNRINVRRLVNLLKKSIGDASQYKLFELNDEFTRSSWKSEVDSYMGNIKAQRGVYDFLTVCDESNNTSQIIDTNWFVGDIYFKPARSINFIRLNFISTSSGTSFEELFGGELG